jgi:hypothetical protein
MVGQTVSDTTSVPTVPFSLANQWAQFGHFFAGYGIVLSFGYLLGWKGLVFGAVGIFLWASIKEGYWDPRHETKIVQGSGWQDWSMYMAGDGAAIVVFLLKKI